MMKLDEAPTKLAVYSFAHVVPVVQAARMMSRKVAFENALAGEQVQPRGE